MTDAPCATPEAAATAHPALRRWVGALLRIFGGGALQALAIRIGQAFLFPLALLVPPHAGDVPGLHMGHYIWLCLTVTIGAVALGRGFPRLAGWRGGAAFLWLVAADQWRAATTCYESIFSWDFDSAPVHLGFLLVGFGTVFFAGAVGAWANDNWRDFLHEEFEEFYESVGLRDEDGNEEA